MAGNEGGERARELGYMFLDRLELGMLRLHALS